MSVDPLAGDPMSIRRAAQSCAARAVSVRTGADAVTSAVAQSSGVWTGKAQSAFVSSATNVPASGGRIIGRLEAAAVALHRYAAEVQQIQDEGRRIQLALRNVADDIASNAQAVSRARTAAGKPDASDDEKSTLSRLKSGGGSLTSLQSRLDGQWAELIRRRASADHRAASALTAPAVVGRLVSAGTVASMNDERLLEYLAGLDRESIRALGRDGALVDRLSSLNDPEEVAAWWKGLDAASQAAFITAVPAAIGNLEGVSYSARSRANEALLPKYLADAEQQLKKWEALAANAVTDGVRAAYAVKAEEWRDRSDGYRAITKALKTAGVSLVSLVPERPPLAQLAIGDLDSAGHVSYVVPGMNTATNVPGTVGKYVSAIVGLQDRQSRVGNADLRDIAVVAWIGYHPPMQDTSAVNVIGTERAEDGARNLVATLIGLHAVRASGGETPDVSVVAHSYGTTTATLALTQVHVDHVVLFGSAGVEQSKVPDASALDVPKGEVFASQGVHDGWAVTGQNLSGRADPTRPSWGAHDFSSEGIVIDHESLHEVDKHGPFGDGRDDFSYLDNGTAAQYRAAQATMGQGADIPRWGTPSDRRDAQSDSGDWTMFTWQQIGEPLFQ